MRVVTLGIALSVAVACGASSAAESMAIFTEVAEKGVKAAKDADELMQRERPQAAVAVLSRHVREVDATIERVEQDPAIALDHKAALLKQLRGYRSDVAQSRDKLRAMVNMMAEFER